MFAHDTFTTLFGTPRPGELEILAGLVRAAVREGFAIVLNEPGSKKPMCTLTAAARKKADREVQDAAAERGDDNASKLRHPCGVHHALTEDDAAKVSGLITRVTKAYGAPPNIGIEPGRSRMLAVDVDTPGERDAFLAAWEQEMPGSSPPTYTVVSPGAQREDGEWVHSEGGHYWFRLPAGFELPRELGVFKDESGWTVAWRGRQLLVPPSVRAEGPYRLVGSPTDAPSWLTDRVFTYVEGRRERERIRQERLVEIRAGKVDTDPVDVWSADTPWAELLTEDGWTATGLVDTCSCPTWTAPGPHGSPKSATAHDLGCTRFDSDQGHAPLHVWTDNPPDYLLPALREHGRTLTRLTYLAWRNYEGDESRAVIGLGLALSESGPMVVDNPFDLMPELDPPLSRDDLAVQDLPTTSPQAGDESVPAPSSNETTSTGTDDFDAIPDVAADRAEQLAKVDSEPTKPVKPSLLATYTLDELDALLDPVPLIHGVLARSSLAILSGKFGTYKSFLAVDWACHVALGRPWQGHDVDQASPVIYIAAEGQVGVKRRFRGWRRRHLDDAPWPDPRAVITIPQRVVLETDKEGKATAHLRELVELVRSTGAGLIVFDTLSKSRGARSEENSNTDMAALMALVIELIKATGACVLLVAHTGYSGEHTRGGSAQEDDADTVFTIKFEDPKSEDRSMANRRVLHHRKAKDEELLAPKLLVPEVVQLGTDDHGRPVTTLVLTTDPFEEPGAGTEPARGPRGAVSVPVALAWFEDQDPPAGMTRRAMEAWVRERGLKARVAVLWDAYKAYSEQDQQDGSAGTEPDDQGNQPSPGET